MASLSSRSLVVQPQNRGTVPAILYSLWRMAETVSKGAVAILPSDRFVDDEHKFMRDLGVALAATALRPELTVLLGIGPEWPESSYGWIEPEPAIGDTAMFAVRRFWEKARIDLAGELLRRGCLWNSFVTVGRLSIIIALFIIAPPDLLLSFKSIRGTLGTKFEDRSVERLYAGLRPIGFRSRSWQSIRLTLRCCQCAASSGATWASRAA